MSNPTDPTEPGTEATPGTDLEKKKPSDVAVSEQPIEDAPKSNRLRTILIAAGIVVVLAVAAGLSFALLAPQGMQPGGPDASAIPTPSATAAPPTEEVPVDPNAPVPVVPCTTNNLKASLGEPIDVAGKVGLPIIFTNSGDQNRFGDQLPCTLKGFPSVWFIDGSNGTQIGAAAVVDGGTEPAEITLGVDGTATALVTVAAATAADCNPIQADGFRVALEGASDSFFVETTDYQACQNPATSLLTIGAITG